MAGTEMNCEKELQENGNKAGDKRKALQRNNALRKKRKYCISETKADCYVDMNN